MAVLQASVCILVIRLLIVKKYLKGVHAQPPDVSLQSVS